MKISIKSLTISLIDFCILLISAYLSFYLRTENFYLNEIIYLKYALYSSLFIVLFNFSSGLYSYRVSYFNYSYAISLTARNILSFTLIFSLNLFYSIPASIPLIHFLLSTFSLILFRLIFKKINLLFKSSISTNRIAFIVYSNESSHIFYNYLTELYCYSKVYIVDNIDNRKIHGYNIVNFDFINNLSNNKYYDFFIIDNNCSNEELQLIIRISELFNLKLHHVNKNFLINFNNKNLIQDFNDDVLLGRSLNSVNDFDSSIFYKKNILVTGGAGSIGSEIVFQMANMGVNIIYVIDNNELALYNLSNKISSILSNIKVEYILGDIRDEIFLRDFFNNNLINYVFHAAAYKHVNFVEYNIIQSFKNNVLATYKLIKLCLMHNINGFTLISTDKAVRPTNIMGVTKRIAELITLGANSSIIPHDTFFSAVRFGNVLNSNGSAIPLFKSQIQHGGPVTITDFNVTRYFMTIPEAARLVIAASTFQSKDGMFVLDMGKPYKILDLVKRLITLSGKHYNVIEKGSFPKENFDTINIIETGLRQGEKLFEELSIDDNISVTKINKIFKIDDSFKSFDELEYQILNTDFDDIESIYSLIKFLVPEYINIKTST